ncbi:AEC family transporter [Maribrevibacterium harenarium]|uniref:AEC family transporter n=1 Tax=Maribrevibacterium harenarium TaxID=2589817 RepID=A0A501WFZ0_9GAMM|nr:AEC family transporter [Maribrevibacterium harenarium]TPE47395.1 AEC family transporter [Maribrevibacterium harenarium]
MELVLAILPVFLLMLLGVVLQRAQFPFAGFWAGIDKLVYWLLFPALLFSKSSQIDFSDPMLERYGVVLIGAMGLTALFVVMVARWMQEDAPTTTSMLQAGVRFNTFVALALAQRLYGDEGLMFATLGASVLIPSINVFLVVTMVTMHATQKVSLGKVVAKEILRNPLILALAAGMSLNALGLTPVLVISDMAATLAQATLPLVLLAVGASVRLDAVKAVRRSFWVGAFGRFILFPATIVALCWWLDIDGVAAAVALLFGVVPTATSSYALARQLGGNAEKMAAYITLQTAISIFTVPATIALYQAFPL